MYLNIAKKKDGNKYLSIREKYYIPGKGSMERTVEPIGWLFDLQKDYDDPIGYFREYAKRLTEEKKKEKIEYIPMNKSETMAIGTSDTKNVGYGIIKVFYKLLELDKFWNWKTKNLENEFSVDKITKLLVFSRALTPASKRATLKNSNFFFEPFDDISEDDIYHALDIIAENQEDLQSWLYEKSEKLYKHDMSTAYFDCTNYYFDISRPDTDLFDKEGNTVDEDGNPCKPTYRKRGPEKNHRPDPIIEMGLLFDKNSIPVAYDLFPGNESEKHHLRPIIERVKLKHNTGRVIVVADRGLNTGDNIYWLNGDNTADDNQRDGYVYGQTIRGASEEFKKWVLDQTDYVTDEIKENCETIRFKHKSRIEKREINVNLTRSVDKPKKKKVKIDQKQMVYYSEKYAKKQRRDRDAMIERAKDLIKHPKKYTRVTAKGSTGYIKNISFDKTTGEVIGTELYLDEEKIKEEEKYDGYYSIVTSELNLSDLKIREIYRGLIRIEDTFKVTKSYLKSRPIYVWLTEHIEAHFAICYITLLILRLLEHKLGGEFSPNQILESLNKYTCVPMDTNNWKFTYYDEIIDRCSKEFSLDLNKRYRTRQEIQRLLRY